MSQVHNKRYRCYTIIEKNSYNADWIFCRGLVTLTDWPWEMWQLSVNTCSRVVLVILLSSKCHWVLFDYLSTLVQDFRYWIGAVRQQAITWASVDPDLCFRMSSSGHRLSYIVFTGINSVTITIIWRKCENGTWCFPKVLSCFEHLWFWIISLDPQNVFEITDVGRTFYEICCDTFGWHVHGLRLSCTGVTSFLH